MTIEEPSSALVRLLSAFIVHRTILFTRRVTFSTDPRPSGSGRRGVFFLGEGIHPQTPWARFARASLSEFLTVIGQIIYSFPPAGYSVS